MFLTFQEVANSIPLHCHWVIHLKQLLLYISETWSVSANKDLSFTCMLGSVVKGKELLPCPEFSRLSVWKC